MSDPQIVDAIESNFVPVCIYNNVQGQDAKIVAQFQEPTWNYPVSRVIDQNSKDVVPRSARWKDRSGLVNQIIAALKKRGKAIPGYLQLLALNDQAQARRFETAVFGMS